MTTETLLKRTLRQVTALDKRPLLGMYLMAERGELTVELQVRVAEHYGFAPSFGVLGVLRELAAEITEGEKP